MKKYTVYDKKTGTINKILSCHVSQLSINLQPDEDYIEGEYVDTEYKIDIKDKKPVKVKEKTEAVLRNEYEELIMAKMQEIIRRKAIEELKKEGKLPKDFKEDLWN